MRGKTKLVSIVMLMLWCLTGLSQLGQGVEESTKAVDHLQPVATFQDDESPQLRAIGNPKRTEEIQNRKASEVDEAASVAQFQQLQNGVPGSGVAPASTPGFCTYDLNRNQFVIFVPGGATNLRFTLTGSPSNGDIDLAVRYNQPVNIINNQLIADFTSQSPGGFEEILIPNPASGSWYVTVGNCELFSVSFTLVASFSSGSTILQIDDGSFESDLGYAENGASTAYFVNRLTPPFYPATLISVLIYFSAGSQRLPAGSPVTILVGVNPSGSSNIDGISFQRQRVSIISTGAFNEYSVDPVTIFSGDFVVGFVAFNPRDTFPASYDETFPRGRSYTTTDGFDFHQVEEFSDDIRPGNFGIRARVEGCGGQSIFPSFNSQFVDGFLSAGGMVDYRFDPVSGARYRFSTCDGFANFDSVIEVFQNGVLVAQNDDCFFPFNRESRVDVTMPSAACAIVRVRGFSSSSSGRFRMVYRRIR